MIDKKKDISQILLIILCTKYSKYTDIKIVMHVNDLLLA